MSAPSRLMLCYPNSDPRKPSHEPHAPLSTAKETLRKVTSMRAVPPYSSKIVVVT